MWLCVDSGRLVQSSEPPVTLMWCGQPSAHLTMEYNSPPPETVQRGHSTRKLCVHLSETVFWEQSVLRQLHCDFELDYESNVPVKYLIFCSIMNNKSLAVTAPPSPPTHLIVTRASVSGVTPPVCHAVRASQSELWVVRTSQSQASAPDTRTPGVWCHASAGPVLSPQYSSDSSSVNIPDLGSVPPLHICWSAAWCHRWQYTRNIIVNILG